MRRLLLSATLIASLAALPSGAVAKYKIGISDQLARTFTNPLYAPLHLQLARYITPWDVMSHKRDKAELDAWITAARGANQRIVVAFQASDTPGQQRKEPSVAKYTRALKKFHKAYPFVKDIQPWNEVNRCQRRVGKQILGQPTCHDPKMAARYYMAARKIFRGDAVTGLDILDQANVQPAVIFIRQFLKYAHPRPTLWGFHNYSDTNRFSETRTKALLKATRTGQVWLTETGGIVEFGRSFPYNQKRAAKAIGCMFTIAKLSSRITRLYVYQFNGVLPHESTFDAGLINPNNTPRPGYQVVKKRKAGRCHK